MSDVRGIAEEAYDEMSLGNWLNRDLYENLPEDEKELAEALIDVYEEVGPFDLSGNIWVGYKPESENEDAGMGVRCDNCALYADEGACLILDQKVEARGMCRFAIIPPGEVEE